MSALAALASSQETIAVQESSLLCWSCSTPLGCGLSSTRMTSVRCDGCGVSTQQRGGVWLCLSPDHERTYKQFISEYEFVRADEGRGSPEAAFYLALPYADLSSKMAEQWKIRARTYDHIRRSIIEPIAARQGRPLCILDLGAGNGWLSYRLALLGHLPVAVDLLVNDQDGLGAAKHYASHLADVFPRVQATLDQLPLESGSFDLVIFNASFHYAKQYSQALAEAIRCLRPGGTVVVADTPWYARCHSGEKMVAEKRAYFRSRYGFESSSVGSQEFLTPERLDELAELFHLKWRVIKPFYGTKWTLRPLIAKLKGRRTPSHFYIHVAEVAA